MQNLRSRDDLLIERVNEIINENLENENFSVAKLAESVSLSRSMLHRKLKKTIGKSATELITETRLNRAKELLINNVATASEIAYRVGFNSPSYFNTVFKKKFNVSPGNIRRIKEAEDLQSATEDEVDTKNSVHAKKYGLRNKTMLFATLALIVFAGLFYLFKSIKPIEKSIAVLPLNNLTGNPENAYFVDGIHDALIGELGRISAVRVISRTSTLRFRDANMLLGDIANELGVNTIVEGSVIGAGDSIRILIQLIDVFPKERHLLAKEYYDNMPNILNVQTEVAKDIAQKIRVELTEREQLLLEKSREVDPETYKAYLRGMFYLNQGTAEAFETGIEYFYEAIKRDPGDPFAYGAMALGYAHIGHGQVDYQEAFHRLESSAKKAIKLDPASDEAHTALAIHHLYNVCDWPVIEREFEIALKHNPNNEIAHAHYAWYHILFDDIERSIYHAKKAVLIEPFSASYTSWLALLYWYNKDFNQAEHWTRRALELKEDSPYGNLVLSWINIEKGQYENALEITEKLPDSDQYWKMLVGYNYVRSGQKEKALVFWNDFEEESKNNWVNSCYRGMMASYLGFTDDAFKFLNEAVEYKLYPITYIKFYPMAEDLRSDPRYNELLKKMNLPYQNNLITSTR